MTIRCFFMGCRWETGLPMILLGGERIRWQLCKRCGAHRYVTGEDLDHE